MQTIPERKIYLCNYADAFFVFKTSCNFNTTVLTSIIVTLTYLLIFEDIEKDR